MMIFLVFFVTKFARIMPRCLITIAKLMNKFLWRSSWTKIIQQEWPQCLLSSRYRNFPLQQLYVVNSFHAIVVRWQRCARFKDKFVVLCQELGLKKEFIDRVESSFNFSLDIFTAMLCIGMSKIIKLKFWNSNFKNSSRTWNSKFSDQKSMKNFTVFSLYVIFQSESNNLTFSEDEHNRRR